ncbi:MFS transporter [Candidatus Woesearchaeota archaeon CG10_big_fil_rev_8_21_14_0_10_34_8]|nr:MAG: MFS transporter [Candidatus Woesearchaeota archaeon CG10_big_fil_rev_8_21_14_0_10_34_8]
MTKNESKKTVRVFALASFLNDLGSDMIYPIWPLFVTSVLGANMAVLGFIDGLSDALVSISQAFSGYLSDKIRKRKVFVWLGYIFGSLSRIGYAFSSVWQHLIPFRILDRAGKMRGAPRDAIIADVSAKSNRGKNFGILRAMDNLGAVCGIILCILLFSILGYKKLFIIASLPSVIAALLIFYLIKEKKPAKIKIYKGLSFKNLNKDFRLFLLLSSFFALGSFSYSFLLIYAKQFGFKTVFVPVLYLIFTAVASVFALPFGKLSDKIGRKPVLMMSYLFWALVCISIIFFKNYYGIIFVFIFYGLHKGALEPVQKTFVSELAPKKYRASSFGSYQMVIGLCALPASLTAGILWDKISIATPFYLSLGLTALSGIMLIFVKET